MRWKRNWKEEAEIVDGIAVYVIVLLFRKDENLSTYIKRNKKFEPETLCLSKENMKDLVWTM